jgi:hypothetical protein
MISLISHPEPYGVRPLGGARHMGRLYAREGAVVKRLAWWDAPSECARPELCGLRLMQRAVTA